jgi:hypothetical protein
MNEEKMMKNVIYILQKCRSGVGGDSPFLTHNNNNNNNNNIIPHHLSLSSSLSLSLSLSLFCCFVRCVKYGKVSALCVLGCITQCV